MKFIFILCSLVIVSTLIMAQNADSAKLYFQKGIVERDLKHYPAAAKFFDKAITFDNKYKEAYLENGNVNLLMRRIDAAKINFIKLNELAPDNLIAIKQLMELYHNYNQYLKAIELANKCTGCDNAEKIIAMSNYKLENYPVAIKGLLNVVAKDNKDAEATYTIGRSYLDMEFYAKAIPYYLKAINLDTTKNLWMEELALIYYNLNDFKNAKNYFVMAAKYGYPLSNDFNENLGYAYIYSGDYEKGEKLLLDIVAKKPGNKDILRDIAEAYYQQKMYDKSLNFCNTLLEQDHNDGKALYQAGLCYLKKGQKEKGEALCDAGIKIDPSLSSLKQKQGGALGL